MLFPLDPTYGDQPISEEGDGGGGRGEGGGTGGKRPKEYVF